MDISADFESKGSDNTQATLAALYQQILSLDFCAHPGLQLGVGITNDRQTGK